MTAVALNVAADLATLTLSAGGKPPTLDHDLLDGLDAAIEAIEKSPQVRAVILRGDTDKYFAVGANINALKTLDESTMARWVEHGHAVFNRLERLVVPTLARVSGWCVGGGLELAMACDLIIASESAKFGQPEAKLGFITGWGGAARLRDRVGAGRARLLLLTGRTIDAAEALRIGLADALFAPEALDAGLAALVDEIRGNAPGALADMKRLAAVREAAFSGAYLAAERGLSLSRIADPDTRQRIHEFLNRKR